jgi:hypothetical protein
MITLDELNFTTVKYLLPIIRDGGKKELIGNSKIVTVERIEKDNVYYLSFISESLDFPLIQYEIIEMDSINNGKYYLLKCPLSGKRIRKLYVILDQFFSRHALNLNYSLQNMSKKQRLEYYTNEIYYYAYDQLIKGKYLYYNGSETKRLKRILGQLQTATKYKKQQIEKFSNSAEKLIKRCQ